MVRCGVLSMSCVLFVRHLCPAVVFDFRPVASAREAVLLVPCVQLGCFCWLTLPPRCYFRPGDSQDADMSAGELDMEKTDFGMTNATTFDHHGSKITAFFIQASIYVHIV